MRAREIKFSECAVRNAECGIDESSFRTPNSELRIDVSHQVPTVNTTVVVCMMKLLKRMGSEGCSQ